MVPAEFTAAPAMIVGRGSYATSSGTITPAALPVAFVAHPNGVYRYEAVATPPAPTFVSPLAQYVAVELAPTGIDPGSFQIKSLATGKVVETAEYQGSQPPQRASWSEDDRLLMYQDENTSYVHRIGGATVDLKASGQLLYQVGYSSTADGSAFVGCGMGGLLIAAIVPSGTTHGESEVNAPCEISEELASNGNPVAVYSWKGGLYRLLPNGRVKQIPTASLGTPLGRLTASCNGLVNFGVGAQGTAVYDVDSGVVTSMTQHYGKCLIPSPDRKKYAFFQPDGIYVVSAGSGKVTRVSRTGSPIAWSADGKMLLVRANGTFLVKADGSGGVKASAQLDETSNNPYLYCRVGDTGTAVLTTTSGLVLYTIDTDKAIALPMASLGAACGLTADQGWLVSGSILVNLHTGGATVLPAYDEKLGLTVTQPSTGLADYRWSGPQWLVASTGRQGTST